MENNRSTKVIMTLTVEVVAACPHCGVGNGMEFQSSPPLRSVILKMTCRNAQCQRAFTVTEEV